MAELPITLSPTKWLSVDQGLASAGVAGGILFSDFVSGTIASAANLVGTTSLLASLLTKGAIGMLTFYAGTKTKGGTKIVSWAASVGCMAGIVIDLVRFSWPTGTGEPGEGLSLGSRKAPAPSRSASNKEIPRVNLPGGGKYISEYGRSYPIPTAIEEAEGIIAPPAEYWPAKVPASFPGISTRYREHGAATGSGESLGGF